jgi:hypothetical protein
MQSHGGPKLVAELPQCLKKRQATKFVADDWRGDSRSASRSPEPTVLNLSVASRHPAKKGEISLERGGSLVGVRLVGFAYEHARKNGRE